MCIRDSYTIDNLPDVDTLEKIILNLGYLKEAELSLNEETDHRNSQRIYPNIIPLTKFMHTLGFQEDIVSRIKLKSDNYLATIYTRNL